MQRLCQQPAHLRPPPHTFPGVKEDDTTCKIIPDNMGTALQNVRCTYVVERVEELYPM